MNPGQLLRRASLVLLGVSIGMPLNSLAENELSPSRTAPKIVPLTTAAQPPEWALWQRHLLDQMYPMTKTFVDKYTRPDGTIRWRDEWPGMDGSDDGYESFYNFALYYALGGNEEILPLAERLWDGVTRQFTQYGQIHNEFDAHYDWMHHGESYTAFYFFGLASPYSPIHRERAVKFAGLYLGEAEDVPNYDVRLRRMRSPLTGSRGPHYQNTAEDWVTHRPILAHYPLPFDDIPNVTQPAAWNDDTLFPHILQAINQRMMSSDVPLNLTATSLMLNAYMYTGDAKYRNWITDYVTAWMERVEQNDGILPDNVGPNGVVGEHLGGNWWGGYYGWKWPHGLMNQIEATLIGGMNAYAVTGNAKYLDLPRSVVDLVAREQKQDGKRVMVPTRHAEQGWYDYQTFNVKYLAHLWYLSRDPQDWMRLKTLVDLEPYKKFGYSKGKGDSENGARWLMFVRGHNDDYPIEMLRANLGESLRRMERIQRDTTTPAEQDVHHWQQLNPMILEGLVQLTMGAPNHIYHGGLLHASVRYFDPHRKRAGLPTDVAAMVDRLTPNGIRLHLVNLNPGQKKRVILQAGAFGEHEFIRIKQVVHYPYQFDTINSRHVEIELMPGAVGRLEIDMRRFVNAPTYAQPWRLLQTH